MNRVLISGIALLMIAGCRKVPSTEELTGNFIVITNRDKEANFASYKTYFISDTISYISNVPTNDTIITGVTAAAIINVVKTNLAARNYQLVARTANPNLGVKVTVIKQLSAGVVYPPGWWWGYPGYPGGCYWGWCYGGYYPYPVAYSYNTGDVITEVYDLKNADANNFLKVIWIANAGGVLSTTTQTNIDQTVYAINQAFVQSPYFVTN